MTTGIGQSREAAEILSELQALEERYRAVFQVDPDPAFALDDHGRLLGGTGLQRLTRTPIAELAGRSFLDLIDPADADAARRDFEAALQGEPLRSIVRMRRSGRALRVTLAPTRTGGRITGVHGSVRDVTRTREVEVALQDLAQRYSLLADNVQDMISLHDTSGVFLYASPSAVRLLGVDPTDLVGRSVYDVVEPGDAPGLRAGHEAILRRDGRLPAVFRARRADGSVRWFETTARMVEDDATGEPWRIIAVTRDISDRRQMEQQLQQSQKMEALGRLAAAVAHDFNNVLTVIAGHAELLGDQRDESAVVSGAEHIREAAMRAAALARQLLTFGRGTSDESTVLDANGTLLELQPLLVRLLGADVQLQLRLDPDLPAILCPPSALEQIAMNLAVNAKDAMPAGGTFAITTGTTTLRPGERPVLAPGEYVVISFEDTGDGIAPDIVGRIFEPFFTTKRSRGGTGLGLSTVYSLVRQSGGDIAVESVPGRGACFRVWFSGHAGRPDSVAVSGRASECLTGRETVLVAEDDPGVRTLITAILQRYGYNVMTAVNGREAMELYRTYGHLVDLLITDISMPEMTGPEFVQNVRAAGSRQPVLFISGFSAEVLPPADDTPRHFLAKPFSPADLARAVRRALAAGAA